LLVSPPDKEQSRLKNIQNVRKAAWHTTLYPPPPEVGQWPDERMLWQAGQLNTFQECDRFCLCSHTRKRGTSLKQQARWEIP
jgi:hypothetical protein